ncbi:YadA family autotransporter adhesin, partial [Stenotrophomonas sp. AB1(2024)]|uniref:YadA family autotransporter adhesin n=1 Tax=Stenotrophomonas sp. AB1(2024) TaxID=3132215 RepID=UPI0030A8AC88
SQLFTTNERVTTAEGDITNLDNRVTTVEGDVSYLTTQIDSGSVGMVRQLAVGNNLTVGVATDGMAVDFTGTAGTRALMGVSAGAVSSTSTEAVNGSQLFGLSQSIAAGLGGGAAVNPDGSLSAPSYSVGGVTVNNLGDAITNLDTRTAQNTTALTDLENGVAGIGNDLSGLNNKVNVIDSRVTGVEDAIASGNFGNNGLINANVEGPRQIALATGRDSMASGNASTATGDNSTAVGNNSVAGGGNSVALGNGSIADRDNTVSVGAAGLERQVTNVAAGTEDTDAVNVAQLKQGVQYDRSEDGSTNYNSITLGQPNGAPVTMSNVAQGRITADSRDVINGSQMWEWTINRDNRYSNASLSHRIDVVERSMQSGIATALAARQAPYVPGKVTYSVGVASYKSQGALGISSRYTVDSGRWSLEGGFSRNGDGTGAYVGVSGVLGD